MVAQGSKLMTTINTVVTKLNDLSDIVADVQALGKRHVGYGVVDEHYDTVAAALLWTLGAGLGDAFTDEVKAAWTEAYTILASAMKEAAASAYIVPQSKRSFMRSCQ